jgi:hypothetical protein
VVQSLDVQNREGARPLALSNAEVQENWQKYEGFILLGKLLLLLMESSPNLTFMLQE